jgi:hypothetical protein
MRIAGRVNSGRVLCDASRHLPVYNAIRAPGLTGRLSCVRRELVVLDDRGVPHLRLTEAGRFAGVRPARLRDLVR